MSNYRLFQVAVLETQKVSKDEKEKAPRIVIEPICVVARNEQDAAIKVAMTSTSKLKGIDQDQLEVVVRPF
jgi:hypothetical protein